MMECPWSSPRRSRPRRRRKMVMKQKKKESSYHKGVKMKQAALRLTSDLRSYCKPSVDPKVESKKCQARDCADRNAKLVTINCKYLWGLERLERIGNAPLYLTANTWGLQQLCRVLQCRERRLPRQMRPHLGGGGSGSQSLHADVVGILTYFRAHSAWKPYYPGL